MNTYVRIYCSRNQVEYPNWFWMVTGEEAPEVLTDSVQHNLKLKLQAQVSSEFSSKLSDETVDPNSPEWELATAKFLRTETEADSARSRGAQMRHAAASYLERYPEEIALIRETGTWMTFCSDHTVLEARTGDHFPHPDEGAEIVICENDMKAEPEWWGYLQERFSTTRIRTLNLFRARTVEELIPAFQNAELITFMTTFTSYDWWELAVEALSKIDTSGKKILGYCPDQDRYQKALEILGDFPNIELLEEL